MSRTNPPQWTDERLLQLLHLKDVDGLSFAQIATRFGVSRSSVIGAYHRIARELKKMPPDRHDGSMPIRWWAERQRSGYV